MTSEILVLSAMNLAKNKTERCNMLLNEHILKCPQDCDIATVSSGKNMTELKIERGYRGCSLT